MHGQQRQCRHKLYQRWDLCIKAVIMMCPDVVAIVEMVCFVPVRGVHPCHVHELNGKHEQEGCDGQGPAKPGRVDQVRRTHLDSHLEPVGCGDTAIPEARVLDRAALISEVDIGEAIALAVTIGPLEVIEQCPGMVSTHFGPIGDGS